MADKLQKLHKLGPVARSLVSANRWLRGIKMYRFPWYLTLVSTNHASSNPGLAARVFTGVGYSNNRDLCEIGSFSLTKMRQHHMAVMMLHVKS